ncbi:hypothetical protein BJX62DRAFT_234951 [Aspergillus germanicus]
MPKDITVQPDWVMDLYFVRIGDRQPDRMKTTAVIKQSFPRSSEYRDGSMREAASKVEGLHYETGWGPNTRTIFMGWDSEAVKAAAERHAAAEKEAEAEEKKLRAQEKERQKGREKMHKDYVQSLKKSCRKAKPPSPVGSYIVDCQEIERNWPDLVDDSSLDIHDTDEPGVFQACFDFGILEGVMIIGKDSAMVEQYFSQADDDDEGYLDEYCWDEDEDEDDEDERHMVGSKRKASAQPARGSKKAKAGRPPSHTYQLRLRCREHEGQIYSDTDVGTIKIKDGNLISFVGEADLPSVGGAVSFTARKVSDAPCAQQSEWAEYSEQKSEYARVSRWY